MKGAKALIINPQNNDNAGAFSFVAFVGRMSCMCIATIIIADNART